MTPVSHSGVSPRCRASHTRLVRFRWPVAVLLGGLLLAGPTQADAQERRAVPRPPDSEAKPPERREPQRAPERREPDRREAQRRQAPRRPAVRGQFVFIGGYFYDPFYGPYPWWPRTAYPRHYSPIFDMRAHLRVEIKPREASVYVDGFYAGIVDDFDGVMQALPLPPGGHEITVYLEGYRTLRRSLYLRPGSSIHLKENLDRTRSGETSEPPPAAPSVPEPPPGSYSVPRMPSHPAPTASGSATSPATAFGTLDLTVQPVASSVTVDGRPWLTSDDGHFAIELPAGTHRVEASHKGYPKYTRDVVVREGETTSLNVSLMVN